MIYFGGIEGGGTKTKCIIAADPEHVLDITTFPTTNPAILLPGLAEYFLQAESRFRVTLSGLGLAYFGPLDLDPQSQTYGAITTTPKLEWQNVSLKNYFQDHLQIPVAVDTDVNAAANAERLWGAARGLSDFAYITIGTGIGAGIFANGKPIHGMVHPEFGHFLLRQDPSIDPFPGVCPYHRGCLEGLASGPSMAARWQVSATTLPDDHPAWDLEASYLGQAIHALTVICSPQRVILGGGVMDHAGLIELVRLKTLQSINNYVKSPLLENIDSFVVKPELGDKAGALGAISLMFH